MLLAVVIGTMVSKLKWGTTITRVRRRFRVTQPLNINFLCATTVEIESVANADDGREDSGGAHGGVLN